MSPATYPSSSVSPSERNASERFTCGLSYSSAGGFG